MEAERMDNTPIRDGDTYEKNGTPEAEEATVTDDTAEADIAPEVSGGEETAPDADDTDTDGVTDYAALAAADMRELCELFPELSGKKSITELDDPLRYAALRDLGLTPREAYLATAKIRPRYDNRSHLKSDVPRGTANGGDELLGKELDECRELFFGLSDREIQKLYKKVTR